VETVEKSIASSEMMETQTLEMAEIHHEQFKQAGVDQEEVQQLKTPA
jgi:hypothetical protein